MLAYFLALLETDAERQKFTTLYERYHSEMEQTALRILEKQHDAEDAVQNSFIQIIRHFEKVYEIPYEELPFWIMSIVKNESLIILRKRKKVAQLENWNGFEMYADEVTGYMGLVDLFRQLPEIYRGIMEMKLLIGYTDKEISRKLGISETAVSSRASRGRELLRRLVKKEGMHI